MEQFHGTTILSIRRDGVVAMGGDGQVSMGNTVMKGNARKVRRLYRDVGEEHAAISDAVLSRNSELACQLTESHYMKTLSRLGG